VFKTGVYVVYDGQNNVSIMSPHHGHDGHEMPVQYNFWSHQGGGIFGMLLLNT
jgi:hypothetical protein